MKPVEKSFLILAIGAAVAIGSGIGLTAAHMTLKAANGGSVTIRSAPGSPIDAFTPDDCPAGDISTVIEIRLTRKRILNAIDNGNAECPSKAEPNNLFEACVTRHAPDPKGADDDLQNDVGTYLLPPEGIDATRREWATPFDVDLAGLWEEIDSGENKGLHRPILLKIVLFDDDQTNGLRFYRPNDPQHPNDVDFQSTPDSVAEDSSWALRPGGENRDMFYCRSNIHSRQAAFGLKPAVHSYVTVRVRWTEYGTATKNHRQVLGGLNIGLIFKQAKNANYSSRKEFMPVYFDPITHPNG